MDLLRHPAALLAVTTLWLVSAGVSFAADGCGSAVPHDCCCSGFEPVEIVPAESPCSRCCHHESPVASVDAGDQSPEDGTVPICLCQGHAPPTSPPEETLRFTPVVTRVTLVEIRDVITPPAATARPAAVPFSSPPDAAALLCRWLC